MDDLVQFLRDRLDEDKAAARRAGDSFRQVGETGVIVATEGDRAEECASANWAGIAEHIVRHDPARVLAEVEAKRLALDHYTELQRLAKGGVAIYRTAAGAVGVQIQIMAMAYTRHPAYNEAWRPEHLG
ncbi:DUF6221 family protein [Streptomyces sp. NPDC057424]|uniref:DUF6221 family protein n=1 Tax=Streptomyces sp. NPDC057424 TaxID=3346127 RepID=UPI0036CA1DBF